LLVVHTGKCPILTRFIETKKHIDDPSVVKNTYTSVAGKSMLMGGTATARADEGDPMVGLRLERSPPSMKGCGFISVHDTAQLSALEDT
jgi:hypothetical protein